MTFRMRPLGVDDIPALAALMTAVEAVDQTGEHYNEADLREEFGNPDLDLDKDVFGVFDGDDLVSYGSVLERRSDQDRKASGFGITRPDRRGEGIGTRLMEATLARAREIQAADGRPLRLLVSGLESNAAQAALLCEAGLEPDRWSFTMRVDLHAPVTAPELPAGYAVRTFETADADRWLTAHNIAFADHPNFAPWQPSEWQQWVVGSRSFRPELSFFVTPVDDPQDIAAYVQTNEFDAYTEATGRREAYVNKVGTLPGHRGRGLASTLLQTCLVAYRDAGYDEASLDVDSLNPTGALGIYERAGFVTERTFVTYSRTLG